MDKKYKILYKNSGDIFAEKKNLNAIKKVLLKYIKNYQQQYIESGDKTNSDVKLLIKEYKSSFCDLEYFNETLNEFGFKEIQEPIRMKKLSIENTLKGINTKKTWQE